MKVLHTVVFDSCVATLDQVLEAMATYDIPGEAKIFESEDDYRVKIEWGDGA